MFKVYNKNTRTNKKILNSFKMPAQLTFTCSKSTIETLEKDVKYVLS